MVEEEEEEKGKEKVQQNKEKGKRKSKEGTENVDDGNSKKSKYFPSTDQSTSESSQVPTRSFGKVGQAKEDGDDGSPDDDTSSNRPDEVILPKILSRSFATTRSPESVAKQTVLVASTITTSNNKSNAGQSSEESNGDEDEQSSPETEKRKSTTQIQLSQSTEKSTKSGTSSNKNSQNKSNDSNNNKKKNNNKKDRANAPSEQDRFIRAQESDSDDEKDRPFRIEYATTGRATCKTCDQRIVKGELRVSHCPLFRGKPGFLVYRHLHCAIFSERITKMQQVGGWRRLSKQDKETLTLRIEESRLLLEIENQELEPDELVQVNFSGEIRKSPPGLAGTLLPFQVEGASWMYHQERNVADIRGGILGMCMTFGSCFGICSHFGTRLTQTPLLYSR